MDIQKSVIVIIKDQDKILLQKNEKWNDISFVGGKVDAKDDDPMITAYREVQEELNLWGGRHFILEELEPNLIEVEKFSKRTETNRKYIFYLFFMKMDKTFKNRINLKNNFWISLSTLNNSSLQISEIVKETLPKLNLADKDTFEKNKEDVLLIYKEEVLKSLSDEESHGVIDDIERRLLNRKKRELGINELIAKQIEDSVISSYKKVECNIENLEIFGDLTSTFSGIVEDLKIYGKIKGLKTIQISNIYNEGKTGALVFQVYEKKEENYYSRILKYDYRPRIIKEYKIFKGNEKLQGVYASPKCEYYVGNEKYKYSFLELQPADEYANATQMVSLKKIILSEINKYTEDFHLKSYLSDSIKNIIDWLFRRVYKQENQTKPYIKRVMPFQNSLDQFLPPRRSIKGFLIQGENKEPNLMAIKHNQIISYDIKPNQDHSLFVIVFKVWFRVKENLYRVDIFSDIEEDKLALLDLILEGGSGWNLLLERSARGEATREKLFRELSKQTQNLDENLKEYNLLPIFMSSNKFHSFDTGFFFDEIFQKTGVNYITNCLHGDLNPSNVLICKLSSGKFHPILIDFYDTGVTGNVYYDVARLETEIFIELMSMTLQSVFHTSTNVSKLSTEEMNFLLKFEENLFQFKYSQEFFKGDFVLYEIRNILKELALSQLDKEYESFQWLKNYILSLGVFCINFTKFKNESSLNKLIATILAMRYFYRFNAFETYLDKGFLKNFMQDSFAELTQLTPIQKFKEKCRKQNNWTRTEIGFEKVNPSLFVDFYGLVKENLNQYLKQNTKTSFFVNGDRGVGKTTFIDDYFSSEEFLYPVLYLAGNKPVQNENSFIQSIKDKLELSADWIQTIEYYLGESDHSFCIVVDNIYLNPEPEQAVQALKNLIHKTKGTKIKVIVFGIQDFWNEYLELDEIIVETAYKIKDPDDKIRLNSFIEINLRNTSFSDRELLLQTYFQNYSIEGELFGNALNISNNPGILKLFCEIKKGSNIGKLDQVFLLELMESYVNSMLTKVSEVSGISLGRVNTMFVGIAEKMKSTNINSLPINLLAGMFNQDMAMEYDFQQFLTTVVQLGYMNKAKEDLSFSYQEVPAYLLANQITAEWNSKKSYKDNLRVWFEEHIKNLHRRFMNESLIYYVLAILYKNNTLLFNTSIEKIITLFDVIPYGVLRTISRTVSTIPRLFSSMLRELFYFNEKIELTLEKRKKDRTFQREYSSYHYRINLEYGEDAQKWTKMFEVLKTPSKIMIELENLKSQGGLTSLLVFIEKDFKNGSHFVRNFIKPILPLLIENPKNHEPLIFDLCYRFLNMKDTELEFGDFVYTTLAKISDIYIKEPRIKNKALGLLVYKKVENEESVAQLINYFTNWLYVQKVDELVPNDSTYRYYITFLLQYNYLENSLDYNCYEQLSKVLDHYGIDSLNIELKKKVQGYLIRGLPRTYSAVEKLIKVSPELEEKLRPFINQVRKKLIIDEQKVLYIIIKHGDEILLQYKPKWKDYSWIGSQIEPSQSNNNEREDAMKIVSTKLNIQHPRDFEILENKLILPEFKNYSKSRNRDVIYKPTFYILKLKYPYLIEKILSNNNNKFFPLSDLKQPGNTNIGAAVKNTIGPFSQLWEKIPDTI
ncbi:MAG: NUDIX domain-containing protein [Leptospiraceae bacterium]|nr:NUDIX domain-containing protein [Leptospiraceae bacterium]